MSASYPNSVKSFTPKTDLVDDVMAVDVNEIQDEVVAVETDLVSMRTGWIPDSATWTRASNTTFTVSGDVTARFPVGTKIKVTDTTTKYFYVVSAVYGAPNTTVTITAGSDHVLAANPTARWYSYADCPQGFPHWFNYTCVINGSGGTIGTYAETDTFSRFSITGRTLHLKVQKQVTNKGSWSGNVQASLPVPHVNLGSGGVMQGPITWFNGAPSTARTYIRWVSGGTSITFTDLFNASFFDWAELNVGDTLVLLVSYEI